MYLIVDDIVKVIHCQGLMDKVKRYLHLNYPSSEFQTEPGVTFRLLLFLLFCYNDGLKLETFFYFLNLLRRVIITCHVKVRWPFHR